MAEVNWVGVAIAVGAASIGVGAGILGAQRKPHGEVHYRDVGLLWRDGATQADADKIAGYWRKMNMFEHLSMDVELARDHGELTFCPVMRKVDADVEAGVRLWASFVSLHALDGEPVVPQVCNIVGRAVKTLPEVPRRARATVGQAEVWYRAGATAADAEAFAKTAAPAVAAATESILFEVVRKPSLRVCLMTTDDSRADATKRAALLAELGPQAQAAFPSEKAAVVLCDLTFEPAVGTP